jgi:hypothetical protein
MPTATQAIKKIKRPSRKGRFITGTTSSLFRVGGSGVGVGIVLLAFVFVMAALVVFLGFGGCGSIFVCAAAGSLSKRQAGAQ